MINTSSTPTGPIRGESWVLSSDVDDADQHPAPCASDFMMKQQVPNQDAYV
jgi:hypothetical protein